MKTTQILKINAAFRRNLFDPSTGEVVLTAGDAALGGRAACLR